MRTVKMKFLTYTGEVDIDIHDIVMDLDSVFHEKITHHTGATVDHDAITGFVKLIIKENNNKILEFRREEKRVDDLIKKNEKEFNDKIKNGKIVRNLNGIVNKFKCYYLDYILIPEIQPLPIGCGSPGFLTRCETCLYIYDDTKCKFIRKDNNYKLVFED